MVDEGLQYDGETEWMSSQSHIHFTPTEDLSDPLAFVVKQEKASLAVGFHLSLYSTLFKPYARVKCTWWYPQFLVLVPTPGQKVTLGLLATISLEIAPFPHMYVSFPELLPYFKCILEVVFCHSVQYCL
jgi:hypothetical protein